MCSASGFELGLFGGASRCLPSVSVADIKSMREYPLEIFQLQSNHIPDAKCCCVIIMFSVEAGGGGRGVRYLNDLPDCLVALSCCAYDDVQNKPRSRGGCRSG